MNWNDVRRYTCQSCLKWRIQLVEMSWSRLVSRKRSKVSLTDNTVWPTIKKGQLIGKVINKGLYRLSRTIEHGNPRLRTEKFTQSDYNWRPFIELQRNSSIVLGKFYIMITIKMNTNRWTNWNIPYINIYNEARIFTFAYIICLANVIKLAPIWAQVLQTKRKYLYLK